MIAKVGLYYEPTRMKPWLVVWWGDPAPETSKQRKDSRRCQYKRAAAAPGEEPGASITSTFATAAWSPGNGWTNTIPAGTDPVYALSATARSQSSTDEVV